MQCYKLQLAYNGSKFSGLQSNGMFLRTIQDCVELAVNVSFPGLSIRINASGRTDAGVHCTYLAILFSFYRRIFFLKTGIASIDALD